MRSRMSGLCVTMRGVSHSLIPIRVATAEDYERLADTFAASMMTERRPSAAAAAIFEPERAFLAEDAANPVGSALSYTRTLSVPGNVVPAAHVTKVGVAATHRRGGLLTALMRRQLSTVPESFAVLWATETSIYERFGYGQASWNTDLTVDLARARPYGVPASDRLREIGAEEASEVLPDVLAAYQRARPGVSGRGTAHWESYLDDPAEERNGATRLRVLVHETAGIADGYALWRGKLGFGATGVDGEVRIRELAASNRDAYRALWSHLLSMDLAMTLHFPHAAIDEPMRRLVANTRALCPVLRDGLWVRIVDVPKALAQRRYASEIDLVLNVRDDFLPESGGRFRLTGGRGHARCEPSQDRAELSVSIAALGAVYLGGRSLSDVAFDGGVDEHRDGALAEASTAFGWPIMPASIEIF